MTETSDRPVSFSELDTFRQCPFKHQLAYTEGYKPGREKEAFRLGHIWHAIMETHYRVIKMWQATRGHGKSPANGTADAVELLECCAHEVGITCFDNIEDDETRELMVWAYLGYVEAHGCDPQWRIIAIEVRGETPLQPGEPEFVWVIDLVVEDFEYGGIWVVDHKFVGDLMNDVEIELDDQLGLYWLGWSISGDPLARQVNGAMLNQARKKRNVGDFPDEQRGTFKNGKLKGTPQSLEQRFKRERTSRTLDECREIGRDAANAVKAMRLMQQNGVVYSSPNPKQCGWKCDFREVHILSRSSGIPVREILSDFGFTSREERMAAEMKASHIVGCTLGPNHGDTPCRGDEGDL